MYDIIIILLIALFAILGFKKGFVKSIYSIVSLAISYVIINLIKDTFIQKLAASDFGKYIADLVANNYDGLLKEQISYACVYIISLIVLYIAVSFVVKIAFKVIDSLSKLPFINSANKVLGFITGLIIGIIWVIIITNVCYYIPQFTSFIKESNIVDMFGLLIKL